MRVFYVDDDAEDCDFAVEAFYILNPAIEIVSFTESSEAIQTLLSTDNRPDFIFLDINMPKLTGEDCLIAIKKSDRLQRIPCVMCSTTLSTSEMKKYFDLGAHDFIVKPNTISKLRDAFHSILYAQHHHPAVH